MFERFGFNTTTCVRVQRNWLSVRVVSQHRSTRQYENFTGVMVQTDGNGKKKVVAVGQAAEITARSPNLTLRCNAFDHPRVVIDDLEIAVLTLTYFLQQVFDRTVVFVPRLIVQCQRELEGGLTGVERRSLLELAIQAGAREVFLHEATRELSDHELLTSRPDDFQSKWKF